MDTDPEVDVAAGRGPGIGLGKGLLSLHRAPDGIYSTAKLRQHAIPGGIGNPTAMRSDHLVKDGSPSGQFSHGPDLVGPHQAAIALNVSRKNRDQPALGISRFRQNRPLDPAGSLSWDGLEEHFKK
jgi:hypothetical protein